MKNAFVILVLVLICACQYIPSGSIKTANWEQTEIVVDTQHVDITHCDTSLIRTHLSILSKAEVYRNYTHVDRLDSVAAYIYRSFCKYADTVYYQEYNVNGLVYRNVVCSFGTLQKKHIVVGAHYDVCGDQEGADDNASGVTGLMELARLLQGKTLNNQIDLVAYTLEEPPYFRTEAMGSYQHAKSLDKQGVIVRGMICLEMIGYFSDEKNSQSYPIGGMGAIYGTTGDYISIVSKTSPGRFVKDFTYLFKKTDKIETKHIAAPASVQGIDFSDHLNYWKFGYPALMITDTAFYRNGRYHEKSDVMETLDIERMSKVIDALFEAVIQMD